MNSFLLSNNSSQKNMESTFNISTQLASGILQNLGGDFDSLMRTFTESNQSIIYNALRTQTEELALPNKKIS